MPAETGKPFPQFSLQNQDGKTVSLGDYAGKWLVLYVYPKDDTPGCTIQGKSFTATKADFDAAGAVVVGLSADESTSHKSFCDKFSFTIELLADPKHEVLKALGVGQSDYKGTLYWDRTSFVVDPKGVLQKVYEKVKPDGHERVLLDDIKKFSRAETPRPTALPGARRRVRFEVGTSLPRAHRRISGTTTSAHAARRRARNSSASPPATTTLRRSSTARCSASRSRSAGEACRRASSRPGT